MEVRRATDKELALCLQIRRRVFIEEQSVAEHEDVDGLDPECTHYLALVNQVPAGTARLRWVDGLAKAERVAVDQPFRGRGVGHALMGALETDAKAKHAAAVVLGAQVQVVSFYEKRGYVTEGPEFMDAGIPHRKMRLRL